LSQKLFCKMRVCSWHDFDSDLERFERIVESGTGAVAPFVFCVASSSALLQRRNAQLQTSHRRRRNSPLPPLPSYEHERIRLGYFSADFHEHATAHLMAGLIESHDRTRFEVVGFSFGDSVRDSMRTRLEGAFDRFIEVDTIPDAAVAALARSLEIDIAVDLKGFTEDARPEIFAMRPAPIIVNYLGYPGTLGADYVDYLIADSVLVPEEDRQHYAEKIAYLPHSYQANDRKRPIAAETPSAADCGLPDRAFVFCCFNASYKITPEVFDVWCLLLNRIAGSVLWLLHDNAAAVKNLRAEAAARGIAPNRLIFAERLRLADHLARHRRADLFLDTLPCNAHTGASDALWAGLPILTCRGETFAGRVAASLLDSAGLPELITPNLEAYEEMALELAMNPERLARFKEKLAANRLTCPLFDTERFARAIESAYQTMWMRHRLGLPPEHMDA
jgi:predicted O-linked N-acetylglucosamine transferase (SPINDLY family)